MFSTDPNLFPHKEWNLVPPEVVEQAFQILVEEDAIEEKQWQIKQQLYKRKRNSRQLGKIVKKDCCSDDEIESNCNDAQVQLNNMQIPYQLRCHSSIQCVRGKHQTSILFPFLKKKMV